MALRVAHFIQRYTPASVKSDGTRYTWKMDYDPSANSGKGQMTFFIRSNQAKIDESFEGKTFTVNLPDGISGPFHLFVITDADNSVFEYNFEANNAERTANPIQVTLKPSPDLQVTSVAAA